MKSRDITVVGKDCVGRTAPTAGPTSGSTVLHVPVTIANGPISQPITLYYSTTDGTAQSGVNYLGQNPNLILKRALTERRKLKL